MDANSFDSLARTLASTKTRRRALRLLAASASGGIAALGVVGVIPRAAGKQKKKRVTICNDGQTSQVSKKKLKEALRLGATLGTCPLPSAPASSSATGYVHRRRQERQRNRC